MKTRSLACFVCLLALVSLPARSAIITWTNVASSNWNVAANWSPNQVPGTNDTAVITNAVTVTLNISPTVGGIMLGANANCGGGTALVMNNQTLTMNGPLTVGSCGSFTVNSGTLSGTTNATLSGVIGWTGGFLGGSLTVAANGTLNIAGGSGNNDLPNCTLTNLGTVTWSSGHIRVNGGTVIDNQGLWDNQGDFVFDNNGYSGTGTFINSGTFRKSAGNSATYTTIGVSGSGVLFNQTGGILDVQQGLVAFFGGGNLTGGYVTTNSTGSVDLAAGNFTINGTVTSSNVWQAEGNLVGVNVIQGGMNWIEGVWTGATVTIASNTLLTIIGAGGTFQDGIGVPIPNGGFNDLPNCNLTNYGTVVWATGHIRVGGSGTVINNQGLWDCQSDLVLDNNAYNGTATFINSGTFRKSVGAGGNVYTQIGDPAGSVLSFNQTGGVLDVQQGLLGLFGGGNLTGGYVTTNSTGAVDLAGGGFTINGTVTSSNVWQAEGNLVGVNVINGGFNWIEGVWTGATVTIASNSLVTITGAGGTFQDGALVSNANGFNDLPNCNLTNYGTIKWTSGHIRVGGTGTAINNQGLWDCQGDLVIDTSGFNGTATFINSGTFRKSISSGGSSQITLSSFANNGVIDGRSGTLALNNTFTNPLGSLAVENGSKIQIGQAVVIAPTATVSGSGTIQTPSITSSGLVSPGAANATLTIAGNYTQLLPGSMKFDLAGTSPGVNQSQVNITGTAALDGLIGLRFDSGYSPAVNSSNVVLTAGSVAGKFRFLDHFLLLGQNKRMNASYNPTNVVLSAVAATDPVGPSLTPALEKQTFAVFFPSDFAGYELYDKTNLTDPTWTLIPGVTNLYVESSLAASNKFFLLIKP